MMSGFEIFVVVIETILFAGCGIVALLCSSREGLSSAAWGDPDEPYKDNINDHIFVAVLTAISIISGIALAGHFIEGFNSLLYIGLAVFIMAIIFLVFKVGYIQVKKAEKNGGSEWSKKQKSYWELHEDENHRDE